MDFSDYIYVIIGVLWFLFSIIGGAAKAKNKQKQAALKSQPSGASKQQPDTDLRKMLEELMQGKKVELKKSEVKVPDHKKPAFVDKKGPSKLEVHKKHDPFIKERQERKKKSLEYPKEELSSYSESSLSTTSHLQHPPDKIPAAPVEEIVYNLKDAGTQKHPIIENFDGQKAFLFAEIFNRRNY